MPKLTIKAARVNAGYTQQEFANLLGVSRVTVNNWEHGKTEPSASQLRAISEKTDIGIDFIFVPQKTK